MVFKVIFRYDGSLIRSGRKIYEIITIYKTLKKNKNKFVARDNRNEYKLLISIIAIDDLKVMRLKNQRMFNVIQLF